MRVMWMRIRPHSSSHSLHCGHLQSSQLPLNPIPVVGKAAYCKTVWISQQLCMQLFRITPSCHSLCPGSTTGSRFTTQLSTISVLDGKESMYKRCKPPIFSTTPTLVDITLFVLVSLAIYFLARPILSSTLTYLDIKNYVPEYNYH